MARGIFLGSGTAVETDWVLVAPPEAWNPQGQCFQVSVPGESHSPLQLGVPGTFSAILTPSLLAPSPQDVNVTGPFSGLEPASPLIPPGQLQALPPFSAHLTRPGQMLYDPFLPPCSKALKGLDCSPVGPAAGKGPHKHSVTRHTPAAAWW
ncbi:hypothetical protein GH733_004243 [Mirounga leonina]|nr:hypothetical protein GH733_004243 [Mirounga leonina]